MEAVVNDKKIWDEIYVKENFNPGWGTPGLDPNIVNWIKDFCENNEVDSLTLLDVGCGNGRNSLVVEELLKEGIKIDYTGVDFSSKAIEYCKETYKNKKFMVIDITDDALLLAASYDLILDCGCFHAISPEHRGKYITNIFKHSSSEGEVLICTWHREESQTPSDKPTYFPYLYLDEWFFNKKDMKDIFKGKFIVQNETVDNSIYKGINHGFSYFTLIKA